VSAVKRTAQLRVGNLGRLLLQQRSFTAIHVHHAHTAVAFTGVQRHTSERAANEHEQNE